MPVDTDAAAWTISRFGHYVNGDIENIFYLEDAKNFQWYRPPLVVLAMVSYVLCYVLDTVTADQGQHLLNQSYGPTFFVMILMSVVGPVLVHGNAHDGQWSRLLRQWHTLAAQDATSCFVFWCMGVSYQFRTIYVCKGPDTHLYAMCDAYNGSKGVPLFPVPPLAIAVMMALIISFVSVHTIGITATVFSIAVMYGVQGGVLYSLPPGGDARRAGSLDSGIVGVCTFGAFVACLAFGIWKARHGRKSFRNDHLVRQQNEAHQAALERARAAEEKAKEEAEARLAAEQREKLQIEARLASEQREKAERQTMTRYLFHEIRVPLNAVQMGLTLLLEEAHEMNAESRATVEMMSSATGTAVTTLSDALDLAKLAQLHDQPPAIKPLRLTTLVEDAVKMNTPFATGSSVQLMGEFGPMPGTDGMPEWVLGDTTGMKQVLNNFVTNAIKFCPKDGTGQVKVWLGLTLPPEALAGNLLSARAAARRGQELAAQPLASGENAHPDAAVAGANNRQSAWAAQMTTSIGAGTTRTDSAEGHGSVLLGQLTPGFMSRLDADGFDVDMATVVGPDGTVVAADTDAGTPIGQASGAQQAADKPEPAQPAARPAMVTLYMAVRDNGVGISQEELPKLYTAFQQLEAGIEYKGRGTGLGLAITKGLIKRMQGRVGVRSAPGLGSVFYVRLSLPVLHANGSVVTQVETASSVSLPQQAQSSGSSVQSGCTSVPVGAGQAMPGRLPSSPAGPGSMEQVALNVASAGPVIQRQHTLLAPSSPLAAASMSDIRVVAEDGFTDRSSGGHTGSSGASGQVTGLLPDLRFSSRFSSLSADDDAPPPRLRTGLRAEPPTSAPGSVGGRTDSDDDEEDDHHSRGSRASKGTLTDGKQKAKASGATDDEGHVAIAVLSVGRGRQPTYGSQAYVPQPQPQNGQGYVAAARGPQVPAIAADHGLMWPGVGVMDGLNDHEPYLPMARSQFLAPTKVSPPMPGPVVAPVPGSGTGLGGLLSTSAGLAGHVSDHTGSVSSVVSSVASKRHTKGQRVRLLVVEDVVSNLVMLVRGLHRRWAGMGMEAVHGPLIIDEAESGDPALKLVQACLAAMASQQPGTVPYAAILMDGNMPGIDGYEATQRIRQELGYTGLILGLTGNGLPEDVARFMAVGADEVLVKPSEPGEIVKRIKAVLAV